MTNPDTLRAALASISGKVDRIKKLVCGDRAPRWSDEWAIGQNRGLIADLCEYTAEERAALTAPAASAAEVAEPWVVSDDHGFRMTFATEYSADQFVMSHLNRGLLLTFEGAAPQPASEPAAPVAGGEPTVVWVAHGAGSEVREGPVIACCATEEQATQAAKGQGFWGGDGTVKSAPWIGTQQPAAPVAEALASAIIEAGKKAGVIAGDQALTGPQLLLVLDDMATALAPAAAGSAEPASVALEAGPVAWYDPSDFTRTTQRRTEKEWAPLYAAPQAPAAPVLRRLTDEEVIQAQNAAFIELVKRGYSGGMGGETWDDASARAIESALARKNGMEVAP